MNLSKTEKILAAKRKLKEFQQNKLLQDNSSKQQPHNVKCSETITFELDSQQSYSQTVNSTQDKVPTIDHGLETNKKNLAESSPKNGISNEEAMKNISESVFDKIDVDLKAPNVETIDYPTAQTEHILELTSAVKDVLKNDSENSDAFSFDLSCHNQFLNSYLEEQKKVVRDLHLEISNYHSKVADLETKLSTNEKEFNARLERETASLREQLQMHTQSAGILIAEKAELTSAFNQTQQTAKKYLEESEELTAKLKSCQIRSSELEKEVMALKNENEELRRVQQSLRSDYSNLEKSFIEMQKEKENLSMDASELRQKLNLKKTELVAANQEVKEKTALLSLCELRVQQMKDTTQTEEEKQTAFLLEQELLRVKESLKLITDEKEEAGKQYQNYVRQLDSQQEKLVAEVQNQKVLIEEQERREQDYIKKLTEMEQELQDAKEKLLSFLPLQDAKEQSDNLLKTIDELTMEQGRLHISIAEKDTQIEMLNKELDEIREKSIENTETNRLVQALESEQLGASRAVHQNRQLKQQLTDMENAFVSLSNTKLDLTEQLQAERTISRKLNIQLNSLEAELDGLKEKLKEKEAVLLELEEERLQKAQITDQMQHYQAQYHHANTFQRELEQSLVRIQKLEKEKEDLVQKLAEHSQCEFTSDDHSRLHLNEKSKGKNEEDGEENGPISEPLRKLEVRFKETMDRVAELTEEKQKLEHLVLQLQGETDTIGEYITLYQKQRSVLQERAKEREQSFRQLLEQRNQQQEQLHKLKVLVSDFIKKECVRSNGIEGRTIDTGTELSTLSNHEPDTNNSDGEAKNISELLDLIAEIKDCKDSCIFAPDFHACPWCSGKLLTV